MTSPRIYLSPPHLGVREQEFVADAFASNWIAPLGPHVDAFEREFAERVGAEHAVALSSGTAALHLALQLAGVGPSDEVLVSTLTFVASVNPIRYLGAEPVLLDSERVSWNLDPGLLEEALDDRTQKGSPPKAVICVHLYGQPADLDRISQACERHGVTLIEDAAEALGARYGNRHPGTAGNAGVFSFNGNKVITTSGGGMLVTADGDLARHARKLATQAREPAPHYEHREIGYNYRLSNVCAAIGRGQLAVLDDRVAARRRIFDRYQAALGDLPGVAFQPEAPWGLHSRWLTVLTVDPAAAGTDREAIRRRLEAADIEARPVWKPMHLQPLYDNRHVYGGAIAAQLFEQGLCLPSGSSLTPDDQDRVITTFRSAIPSC